MSGIKPILKYGSLAVVLLVMTSILQKGSRDNVDGFYILASAIALATGFLYTRIMHSTDGRERLLNFRTGLLAVCLIILTSVFISGVLYYILGLDLNFLTAQLTFMLPFMIDQSYQYFLKIPPAEYKLWHYPSDEQFLIIDMINTSETQILNFVLNKKANIETKSNFKIEVPVDVPLGQLFYNLIYEYNRTNTSGNIEYTNHYNELSGWIFFTKRGFLKKTCFVDPDLSIKDSDLEPEIIIYAIREDDFSKTYPDIAPSNRMVNHSAASA